MNRPRKSPSVTRLPSWSTRANGPPIRAWPVLVPGGGGGGGPGEQGLGGLGPGRGRRGGGAAAVEVRPDRDDDHREGDEGHEKALAHPSLLAARLAAELARGRRLARGR